ncbi:zinc-binding dehydrogenase [Oceanobacillus profundus]|uniref:zinc-binding dehydrogenase n=1 Tax=Oceanobacillus TaxID=182709 RepID=UPI0026E33A1A|nr:zinc-binding dehydrogenase [Oceanobacillus profundus]
MQEAGGLSLNATALVKEGGTTIIVSDGVEDRPQQAKKFEADYTINLNDYETLEDLTKAIHDLTNGVNAGFTLDNIKPALDRSSAREVTRGLLLWREV